MSKQHDQFIKNLTRIIEKNLENEQFGVSELAREAGMSRSQIHRKLKLVTNQSVSQFIREIRLKKAKELLEQENLTVSEIAYNVGFGSPSYFIKCFHEFYGYAPGEYMKYAPDISANKSNGNTRNQFFKKPLFKILSVLVIAVIAIFFIFYITKNKESSNELTENSIAILPFDNLSSYENTQYFADGIVEDLLNRLSTINNLKVISRTSSEMFRNKGSKTIPEIGELLNVGYILEGTVQRESDNIRISIQLIDAKHDDHVLSKQYDRNLTQLFEVQREIAREIAAEVSPILTNQQLDKLKHDYTKNSDALKLYNLGRFYSNKRTAEGYKKGIEFYEQAIAEDSTYGLAYAGLADNYDLMSLQGHIDRDEGNKIAREMAGKALEIDPDLSEAYTVMGSIYTFTDWNWKAAEKEFLKAIELNPNYSTAHQYYAEFLTIMGRDVEAREHMDKALQLDPFSFIMRFRSSRIYFDQGQFNEALAELSICKDLVKDHWWSIDLETKIYIQLGNEQLAFKNIKYISKKNNLWSLEKADSIFNEGGLNAVLRWRLASGKYEPEYTKKYWYAVFREDEKAMEMLEEAMKAGALSPFETTWIEYKNLRSDPRFIAIRKKMGLPPLDP